MASLSGRDTEIQAIEPTRKTTAVLLRDGGCVVCQVCCENECKCACAGDR